MTAHKPEVGKGFFFLFISQKADLPSLQGAWKREPPAFAASPTGEGADVPQSRKREGLALSRQLTPSAQELLGGVSAWETGWTSGPFKGVGRQSWSGTGFLYPRQFFFKLSPGLPFAVSFTTITIIQYNHHEAWMKRN